MKKNKTLTLDFRYRYGVALSLKGLSFKKINGFSDLQSHLFINDSNKYTIDYDLNVDQRTASIKREFLIKCLCDLYKDIPYSKIKTIGNYELSGDELINIIKERIQSNEKTNKETSY
jgi:hypothetical protein